MDLEQLTIGEARKLASLFGEASTPDAGSEYEIGQCYLIRTVTYATVGRVVRRTSTALVMNQASWVADTGRFGEALSGGPKKAV